MKSIFKFSCYDNVDGQSRITYRVVMGEDNLGDICFWIEQKSTIGKGWFKCFQPHVLWKSLSELWTSPEFKYLFGSFSDYLFL